MQRTMGMITKDLGVLRPEDLASLLTTEPAALLGSILQLNQAPFYHNALNAVVIACDVMHLQRMSLHPGCVKPSTRSVGHNSRLVRNGCDEGDDGQ
ncbi:MAG: hypothetical protein R2811_08445 [Flavobacteriales bacterium]